MTTLAKPVTAEQLLAMGEKARWLELYEGELHPMSPANLRHGEIAIQIGSLLRQYVKPRKLGYVTVEGGYILQRNPDTVLGPDVSFLRHARAPEGLPPKFFEGYPDLAVEIISPTNPRRELERKMAVYLKHGTALAWLVEPLNFSVDIHRPHQAICRLEKTDPITGEDVIPGFSCTVADFFA